MVRRPFPVTRPFVGQRVTVQLAGSGLAAFGRQTKRADVRNDGFCSLGRPQMTLGIHAGANKWMLRSAGNIDRIEVMLGCAALVAPIDMIAMRSASRLQGFRPSTTASRTDRGWSTGSWRAIGSRRSTSDELSRFRCCLPAVVSEKSRRLAQHGILQEGPSEPPSPGSIPRSEADACSSRRESSILPPEACRGRSFRR